MARLPDSKSSDGAPLEQLSERLIAERKVRALAQGGSHGGEFAWAGSQPELISFERGLLSPHKEHKQGVLLWRFPLEQLERWRDWDEARAGAPLALLATSRILYDPTGFYGRVQRMLWHLSSEQLAGYRQELLQRTQRALEQAHSRPQSQDHLLALVSARELAIKYLYPALLTHQHGWPEFELRLPHAWRATAGLRFPKAVDRLEQLYSFGGEPEARQVLSATRGLGLVEEERRARQAIQVGYYDGAVRYLRDSTAEKHRPDLLRWTHLSSGRRDKLSVLLGLSRSPLGSAATQLVRELLEDVRVGR